MFTPDDLRVRRFREEDQGEAHRMISYVQGEEESAELRRQIKLMFLDPRLWAATAAIICVVGISLDIPPIPTSIGVLFLAWLASRRHFQSYWSDVRAVFNSQAADLADVAKFYFEEGRNRGRTFLVAEHRGRIVGTAAVREHPSLPAQERACKLFRVFVHPATRRMGIATRLIREAQKEASKMGYKTMTLRTHKTNAGGLKLYDSLGFVRDPREEVHAAAYPLEYLVVNYTVSLTEE